MTTPLFVAVDGGQSQIRLRDSDSARETIVPGVTHLEGDSTELTAIAIASAWKKSRREGGSSRPVARIMLGLTTLPTGSDEQARLARRIGDFVPAAEVWLTGDAVIAHAGALPERHGIVLVVGTGIACLAADRPSGQVTRVDGDGFLLGDAGAAFWMGRQGVSAVLRAADGRGGPTALTDAATAVFGQWDDLASHIHELPRPVDQIAQFARQVQAAAEAGDAIAAGIIRGAAVELLATARAAAKAVGGSSAPLAVIGRGIGPGTPLRSEFFALLATEPRLHEVVPAGGPLDGALALAATGVAEPYERYLSEWKRK